MTCVALTWFVFDETKFAQALGILTIAYTAPILIGCFFADLLLDRFFLRRMMLVDNLIYGIAFAVLPVLYALNILEV